MNIYLKLTKEFNQGRLRAIVSSGQAVVLLRLAVTSKDGDWIIYEEEEACSFVLKVLTQYGASYRFGAPLDIRWLQGGWSSHFEFKHSGFRVRTDFVSRPPRLSAKELKLLWRRSKAMETPYVDPISLINLKTTMREKDYPVIGELARLLRPEDQLLYSRSAQDLIVLGQEFPKLVNKFKIKRRLLAYLSKGRNKVEQLLDEERRIFMRQDEARIAGYSEASRAWLNKWPKLDKASKNMDLLSAHSLFVSEAEHFLPFKVKTTKVLK